MANPQNTVDTFSGDDDSDWYRFEGPIAAIISGTVDGTSIVQRKNPASTAVAVVNASFTEAGDMVIDYPDGIITEVRWSVSGTSSPAIVAEFKGRPA